MFADLCVPQEALGAPAWHCCTFLSPSVIYISHRSFSGQGTVQQLLLAIENVVLYSVDQFILGIELRESLNVQEK